jgi:hypothetical protein
VYGTHRTEGGERAPATADRKEFLPLQQAKRLAGRLAPELVLDHPRRMEGLLDEYLRLAFRSQGERLLLTPAEVGD